MNATTLLLPLLASTMIAIDVASAQAQPAPLLIIATGRGGTQALNPTLEETFTLPLPARLTIDARATGVPANPQRIFAGIIFNISLDGSSCSNTRHYAEVENHPLFAASGSCTRFLEAGEHVLTVARDDSDNLDGGDLGYSYVAVAARDLTTDARSAKD